MDSRPPDDGAAPERRSLVALLLVCVTCAVLFIVYHLTAPAAKRDNASYRSPVPGSGAPDAGPPARLDTSPAPVKTAGAAALGRPPKRHRRRGGARPRRGPYPDQRHPRPERVFPFPKPTTCRGSLALFFGTQDGTGLWIRVAGGIGIKELPVPPGRQVVRVGGYTLATTFSTPSPGARSYQISHEWYKADGGIRLPYEEQPYRTSVVSHQPRGAAETQHTLRLVPRDLSRRYHVTAQPLTGDGSPAGGPAALICRPAGKDLLFVEIPSGYSAETQAFEVRLARRDQAGQAARWRLVDLPPSQQNISERPQVVTDQKVGPLVVEAAAAESPDLWSWGDTWTERRPHPRGGPAPVNIDGHRWTGVPTLRCQLRTRMPEAKTPQTWDLQMRAVTPQWTPAPRVQGGREGPAASNPGVRVSSPLHPVGLSRRNPVWGLRDMVCGVAYPGQQRFVRIEADAVRYAYVTEPVVFRDADVRYDERARRWRLAWKKAQTLTTASGVSLTALNARPRAEPADPHAVPPWEASLGAEMWLAWRLPDGVAPPHVGSWEQPVQVQPLTLQAPLRITHPYSYASGNTPGWGEVWLPGTPPPPPPVSPGPGSRRRHTPLSATPLYPLVRGRYQPLRLYVASAEPRPGGGVRPFVSSSGTSRSGNSTNIVSWAGKGATVHVDNGSRVTVRPRPDEGRRLYERPARPEPPLPGHLAAVTVLVRTRIEKERHPLTFVVPVTARLPAGWQQDHGSR